MPFVSLTRLRIRSLRFLPLFIVHIVRTLRQVKRAPGFQQGAVLADRNWTFWTMTAWDSQEDMRRFMTTDAHKLVMPYLLDSCDEASVVHWDQSEDVLLSWTEADKRMRETGRASKVRNPSPHHVDLTYAVPHTTRTAAVRRPGTPSR